MTLRPTTVLAVCHNRRIRQHKVFANTAKRGKTSLGWFYGFKVHSVVNDRGDLLGRQLTSGNTDDRKPVPKLAQQLFGRLFGDTGYLSQPVFEQLWCDLGVRVIMHRKRKMPNRLMRLSDKLLLRKRAIVESVFDQLKNISHIEHTRHRSPVNFVINLLAGLVAYTHQWGPLGPSPPYTLIVGRDSKLLSRTDVKLRAANSCDAYCDGYDIQYGRSS